MMIPTRTALVIFSIVVGGCTASTGVEPARLVEVSSHAEKTTAPLSVTIVAERAAGEAGRHTLRVSVTPHAPGQYVAVKILAGRGGSVVGADHATIGNVIPRRTDSATFNVAATQPRVDFTAVVSLRTQDGSDETTTAIVRVDTLDLPFGTTFNLQMIDGPATDKIDDPDEVDTLDESSPTYGDLVVVQPPPPKL